MILIRPSKIHEWLASIEKNQDWLAHELGIGKAYLSQVLHNRCKMSRPMIEKLINVSHIPFESVFFMDDTPDTREFYGQDIYFGKMIKSGEYNAIIADILEKHPPKNGNKK